MTTPTPIEYRDLPPGQWFALDAFPTEEEPVTGRAREWAGLLVDVPPDQLKNCVSRVAFLFVHPDEYRPDPNHVAREVWVRIPGKHRSQNRARKALDDLLTTRH
jgi:hypothetical protein